jgi:hypothetical protein
MNINMRSPIVFSTIKVILVILILIYFLLKVSDGGDFTIFLSGADAIYHHLNCYHTLFTYQGIKMANSYSYSPTFALLLAPVSQLPMKFSMFIFLLSYPFLICRIFKLTEFQLPVVQFNTNEKRLWFVLISVSTVRFILHNAEEAQVNLLLLYLTMDGLYQIMQKDRKAAGGFLIAIGCIIKILPIVFIPYLIYRREFKATAWIILMLAVLIILPAPFLGLAFTKQLLVDWWEVINPFKPEYTYLAHAYAQESIQNLGAFVGVFFSDSSLSGVTCTIAKLSPEAMSAVILLLQAFFVLLTFYFLRSPPFTYAKNNSQAFYEQAYILLITPLIFPHQQKYAFVYILPAYAYIYTYLLLNIKMGSRPGKAFLFWLVLAFGLFTLTTDGLIGMRLSRITQYAKTITFGCFILILLLGYSNRKLSRAPGLPSP